MEIEEACKLVGAVICEFGPDCDKCESCGKSHLQLYYIRTCYEVDEGEYYCSDCIKAMPAKREAEALAFSKWLDENFEERLT